MATIDTITTVSGTTITAPDTVQSIHSETFYAGLGLHSASFFEENLIKENKSQIDGIDSDCVLSVEKDTERRAKIAAKKAAKVLSNKSKFNQVIWFTRQEMIQTINDGPNRPGKRQAIEVSRIMLDQFAAQPNETPSCDAVEAVTRKLIGTGLNPFAEEALVIAKFVFIDNYRKVFGV